MFLLHVSQFINNFLWWTPKSFPKYVPRPSIKCFWFAVTQLLKFYQRFVNFPFTRDNIYHQATKHYMISFNWFLMWQILVDWYVLIKMDFSFHLTSQASHNDNIYLSCIPKKRLSNNLRKFLFPLTEMKVSID